MASGQEQENVLRRRTKSQGNHGFFAPVEDKFPRVRFADPLVNLVPTETVERFMPAISVAYHTIFWIGAILTYVGPAILIGSIAIRITQGYCGVLPYPSALCNSYWIKPQQSALHGIAAGRTPLTSILEDQTALNEMTASLEFLGLPLHTVVTNLTYILAELESTMDIEQFRKSEDIGNVAGKAHQLGETFSSDDNTFRQQISIWEPYGIADLGEMVSSLIGATNTSANLVTSFKELVYHTIPFLSKRSLSYKLISQYHKFISTNYTTEVEGLVLQSTETRLALQDLLGGVGQFETQLKELAPTHADDLVMIRYSTQWSLGVVQYAENHYKSMYTSLQAWSARLAVDVASYDSWWLSTSGLSGSQLRAMLETELKQIAQLSAKSMETRKILDDMFEHYMEDEQVAIDMRARVEAAAVEGRLLWLE